MTDFHKIVLYLDPTNVHDRRVIQGIADYSRSLRPCWNVRILCKEGESVFYSMLDPLQQIINLKNWSPDGIILCCRSQSVARILCQVSCPVVAVEEKSFQIRLPSTISSFSTDNVGIGRFVAKKLIDQGFTQFAFCGVPETPLTLWSRLREESYSETIKEAGLECSVFCQKKTDSNKKIYNNLRKWIQSLPKPVALFASYDVRAAHVLYACHDLEINVPDDVAIIGCGNDQTLCELCIPALSSVDQNGYEIGKQAAFTLHQMMSGKNSEVVKTTVPHAGTVSRQSDDTWQISDVDVLTALRYIRDHACQGIHVSDVVNEVNMSRSSIELRFKENVGHSIHSEIKKNQISRVCHLLLSTDMTLQQIANQTGFPHIQHMVELFRNHTGDSPSQFRGKNRHNNRKSENCS